MHCCQLNTKRKPQRGWWRSASGSVGSGALLVLLPKCPMCIAAYLALGMGGGVAMRVATHLRPLLEVILIASLMLLFARRLAARVRRTA